MKKTLLVLLVLIALPRAVPAETRTVIHLYPPPFTLLKSFSGGRVMMNTFEGSPGVLVDFRAAVDRGEFSVFNLPIEALFTITDLRNSAAFGGTVNAEIMAAGGMSFYFENGALSSVNLSGGAAFGYGYNRNVSAWPERLIVTLYPVYEFPLAIFWKKPHFPWKAAADFRYEFFRSGPVVAGIYFRMIMFPTGKYHEDGVYGDADAGLSLGWIF